MKTQWDEQKIKEAFTMRFDNYSYGGLSFVHDTALDTYRVLRSADKGRSCAGKYVQGLKEYNFLSDTMQTKYMIRIEGSGEFGPYDTLEQAMTAYMVLFG